MSFEVLRERVASLQQELAPDSVEAVVRTLLRQGEDVGGGVNAMRLVRYWLGGVARNDAELSWAYMRLKPALRAALEDVPDLYYFEGD
jgi:hypothetical protein